MNLYEKTYNITLKNEQESGEGLFIAGLFINTDLTFFGDPCLDIENVNGGNAFLSDCEDLINYLETVNIDVEAFTASIDKLTKEGRKNNV